MPAYDYICPTCLEKFEVVKPLSKLNEIEYCPKCKEHMRRKISKGHGGSHGQEAAWITSANAGLTGPYERPVTCRTEYRDRLKKKGLTPIG